ncbi:MAG: hypothetical protein NC191_09110 [Muribaculaceae bacterium]|nr:hypothetical protein [Muribaculaceae bacterium]
MSENVNFGKASGIFLNNLKGGLKRANLQSEEMKSIFDKVDTDKNGILDDNEVKNFAQNLDNKKQDNILDKNEAKNFIKSFGLMTMKSSGETVDMNANFVMQFLQEIQANTDEISSTRQFTDMRGSFVEITNNDGTIETINTDDKSSVKVSKDNEGNTVEEHFDADKKLLSKTVTDSNGNVEEITYSDNGTPASKTIKEAGGTSVTTIQYDESGQPQTKEVKRGTVTSNYEYTEDGTERLTSKVENQGNDVLEKTTTYSYAPDGTVTKNIRQAGKEITQILLDGTDLLNEVVVEGGKTTSTMFNEEGNKTSQSVTIDGQTYQVEYDGNGNTYITVQNNESATAIVNKFGKGQFSVQDLLNLNSGKVHGGGFLVGEKILIPTELDADNPALQSRASSEQAVNTYSTVAAPLLQEVDNRNGNMIQTTYNDCNTFEEVAKKLYEQEGVSNPSSEQIRLRTNELKELNPSVQDGSVRDQNLNVTLESRTYNQHMRAEAQQQAQQTANETRAQRAEAKRIGLDIYNYCGSHAMAANDADFLAIMDRITPDNVMEVLNQYDNLQTKIRNEKRDQNSMKMNVSFTSLVDTINSEWGNSKAALGKIIDNLEQAARNAGVPEDRIKQDVNGFKANMSNTKEMERYLNDLRNLITSAQNMNGSASINETEAMNILASDAVEMNEVVQNEYSAARAEDTWEAKTGDVVCGWFGCKTVADMDKELDKYDADIQELIRLQKNGDIEGFKTQYKNVFGVDFNPELLEARENAMQKLEEAAVYESANKTFQLMSMTLSERNFGGSAENMWYELSMCCHGMSAGDIEASAEAYAQEMGLPFESYEDKRRAALEYVHEGMSITSQKYIEVAGGNMPLSELVRDVQQCNDAAFGSHGDKLPDVLEFNKNMRTTGFVVEGLETVALEVAGSYIPGACAVAAARVGKYAAKSSRIMNMYRKAQTAVNAAKNSNVGRTATRIAASRPGRETIDTLGEATYDAGKDIFKDLIAGNDINIQDKFVDALEKKLTERITRGLSSRLNNNEITELAMNIYDDLSEFLPEGYDWKTCQTSLESLTRYTSNRIAALPNPSNEDINNAIKYSLNNYSSNNLA